MKELRISDKVSECANLSRETSGNNPVDAFAHTFTDDSTYVSYGLSKREHFAAMAMQGMCANSSLIQIWTYQNIAEWSVQQADALIEALNK
jgi:hypothetical protein